MSVESRTRITLWLPAPTNLPQWYLVDSVITDLVQACAGATISECLPPVFTGFWIDGSGQTQRDANILIVADAPVPLGDSGLAVYLDKLKPNCQKMFNQDIVWITLHAIVRVDTDDNVK